MKYYATIDTNENRVVSVCAIANGVEILTNAHEIISEITKEQYDTIGMKEADFVIENGNLVIGQLYDRTPTAPSEVELLQQTVADLESQNTDLMLAIAEMAEATEQSKTETQLAIAELAEIIAGGA